MTEVLSLPSCPQINLPERIMVTVWRIPFQIFNVYIDLHKGMPTYTVTYIHTFIQETCISSYMYIRNEIILYT